MGVSHNRWHVRDVAIALLVSMTSASESATAVEVIDDHQRAAAWISDEALEKPLSTPGRSGAAPRGRRAEFRRPVGRTPGSELPAVILASRLASRAAV